MAKPVKKVQVKVKKNGNGNGTKKKVALPKNRAASAPNVQGVMRAVGKAFGGNDTVSLRGWDAFDPAHLPLPRAVGEYTVTRVTQHFSSGAELIMLCPFRVGQDSESLLTAATEYSAPRWSTVMGLQWTSLAESLNTVSSCVGVNMTALENYGTASVVPAAFSVQVMNANALQSADGLIFAGRSNAQIKKLGSAESVQTLADSFVAFMKPRLLAGGKLALRGIHVDSYPLDMNELASFTPLGYLPNTSQGQSEPDIVWDRDGGASGKPCLRGNPAGFAPIFIYNRNAENLQYLVTVELRSRFDVTTPAAASHRVHNPATDRQWANAIKKSASLGHGAKDIAETTAAKGIPK